MGGSFRAFRRGVLAYTATMHPLLKLGLGAGVFAGFFWSTWKWRWFERPTRGELEAYSRYRARVEREKNLLPAPEHKALKTGDLDFYVRRTDPPPLMPTARLEQRRKEKAAEELVRLDAEMDEILRDLGGGAGGGAAAGGPVSKSGAK